MNTVASKGAPRDRYADAEHVRVLDRDLLLYPEERRFLERRSSRRLPQNTELRWKFGRLLNLYLRWSGYRFSGERPIYQAFRRLGAEILTRSGLGDGSTLDDESLVIEAFQALNGAGLYARDQAADEVAVSLPSFTSPSHHPNLRRLRSLVEGLRVLGSTVHTFAVHGSYGDGTFHEHFSDLDVFLVLEDEVLSSPHTLSRAARGLQRVHRRFFEIDPLAHHEFGRVFIRSELDVFPAFELPVAVVATARHLLGAAEFSLTPVASPLHQTVQFFSVLTGIRSRLRSGVFPHDRFTQKALISDVALLPCRYYQMLGDQVTKLEGILRFRREFNDPDFLSYATRVRQEWRVHRWIRWFPRIGTHYGTRLAAKLSVIAEDMTGAKLPAAELAWLHVAMDDFFTERLQHLGDSGSDFDATS